MKSLALMLFAAGIAPTIADTGMSAPSTLPGQNAPALIHETPPVALPMPVIKPQSSAPGYPPASLRGRGGEPPPPDFLEARKPKSKTEVLRQQEGGMGASNVTTPIAPLPQRPETTHNTGSAAEADGLRSPSARLKTTQGSRALHGAKINGEADIASPNANAAQVNAALAARFQSAELDETDRSALGIDAKQFAELTSALASMRVQTAPMVATQRIMDAPGTSSSPLSAIDSGKMKLALNPELWCKTYRNNQAGIARIVPASDNQLAPDQLFVVKGTCFGEQPGTLEIRFRGSPARAIRARIINWAPTMVHAQLPDDITGVTPQNVDVVLVTRDNRAAPARSIAFTPRWGKVWVDRYARNIGCHSDPAYPHTRSYCKGTRNSVPNASKPFDMDFHETYWRNTHVLGIHYTEEDLAVQPVIGTDRWTFDLPPYVRIAGWETAEYRSPNPSKYSITVRADPDRPELEVRWLMADMREENSFAYYLYRIQAWVPVGTLKP